MIKWIVLAVNLAAIVAGDTLTSAIKDGPTIVTDEDRAASALSYAQGRLDARTELLDELRTALTEGTSDALSDKMGAHHQLGYLPASLESIVSQSEYFADYIYEYTSGQSDNARSGSLDYYNTAIEIEFPTTNTVPSYMDCTVCDSTSRYPNYDGTCNNVDECQKGSRGSAMTRLLPAQYDNYGEPRSAETDPLSIANDEFSITTDETGRITSPRYISQMTMTFGQFLAHDKMATPGRSVHQTNGDPIDIDCTSIASDLETNDCFIFGTSDNNMKNFVRSATAIVYKDKQPKFGNREQMNAQTAYIDGSHIYGTTDADIALLADYNTGLLNTKSITTVDTEEFLLTSSDQYCEEGDGNECFVAGDGRVNVHLGMMMLHTLFTREHNYIAGEISALHSDWDGEKVFQETRRIIMSYLQKVTYVDYLPVILGSDMMSRYNMNPTSGTMYDSTVDAGIYNSYGAAAFRFGHSQVYNEIRMASSNGILAATANLWGTMFDPEKIYKESNGFTVMRRYLMGLALDVCDSVDTSFANGVATLLFKSKTPNVTSHLSTGTSLPALNIQRGRDHGLPPCGDFMDLVAEKTGDTIANIDDETQRAKDLYQCGLEEDHMADDAEVGPLFGHIIASQSRNTLVGDRFFYSHTNTDVGFTAAQRAEIEKFTLAQVICRHVNTVEEGKNLKDLKMAANVFFTADVSGNELVDCDDDILPGAPDISVLLGDN